MQRPTSNGANLERRDQTVPSGRYERLIVTDNYDQLWTKCVNKGESLTQMMLVDDHLAGQMFEIPRQSAESKFTDNSFVTEQGYTCAHGPSRVDGLEKAMEHLGLCIDSTPVGNNAELVFTHGGYKVLPNENTRRGTFGSFKQIINPLQGFIIGLSNLSPAKFIPPLEKIPELCYWSDIVYLQYIYAANLRCTVPAPLRYVFRSSIANHDTKDIIYGICNANGERLMPWPGTTYSIDSKEGQALLGTPNGRGVAFLLIQHKRQLGHKVVDGVTVFIEGLTTPSLLFYIRDV
ncbi:hypothetical protein K505DRAFT_342750 [Melanomma pulvis-pyrius CBS 109.77]|uniref:Uncharacterized protein n=1 Tax=Melanomma pulvis-pyrius CBS 109.77 TaxID=1314802 RepID=A0A6A6WUP4_9PLEO|nr:hypothetical protein K505DRAFT_342750 [Melanomma pulvis-pyrius CBS 109.77]